MDRQAKLRARSKQREATIKAAEVVIRAEWPEVERVFATGRYGRVGAANRFGNMIAEGTGRTLDSALQNLATKLGYRAERMAEMEAQRVLFNAAVPA